MTLMFLDHDNIGAADAVQLTENARLPNHISPGKVLAVEERDIGEWRDDHPLNYRDRQAAEFARLFHTSDEPVVLGEQGERAFYDLMQAYRMARVEDQKHVAETYAAVKAFIKKRGARL